MYKKYYSRFLEKHPGELHFTAHSHHFWPDVTEKAVLRYWEDSATYVDEKWAYLYREVIPQTQQLVADLIGSDTPQQIVFAPNTHEFVCRLLSCFTPGNPLSVLTTDSEFHSFRRQLQRLSEYPWITVKKVPSEPISDFDTRFLTAAHERAYEFVFLSQVFFNSGYAINDLKGFMKPLLTAVPKESIVVLDGYHGFCALPTDISSFSERVFFVGGGYKYAQAGEGVCFMHVPPGSSLRPVNTGWFAEFSNISADNKETVSYADDGLRFAGATFDPSGIYRLKAVLELYQQLDLNIDTIHGYISSLQALFINHLKIFDHPDLNENHLLFNTGQLHGHFLSFQLSSPKSACLLVSQLKEHKIYTDYRGNRLRFGFGLYHDQQDIEELFRRLASL